jgi:hypothetical protein
MPQKPTKNLSLKENFKEVIEEKIHEDLSDVFELSCWLEALINKETAKLGCDLKNETQNIQKLNSLAIKLQNDYISCLRTEDANKVAEVKKLLNNRLDAIIKDKQPLTGNVVHPASNWYGTSQRSKFSEKLINELQNDLMAIALIEQKKTRRKLAKIKQQLEQKYGYSKLLKRKYPTVRLLIKDLILMEVCEDGLCRRFVAQLKEIRPIDE